MPITILDVAKHARVSPGTVSNTLSGKRPVAPETRERIYKAIEELGYEPNLLARSLVNQRSHIIAIVITEFQDLGFYAYTSTLAGIQQEAMQLGYSVMLYILYESSPDEIISTLTEIKNRKVDGILWAIHEIEGNRDWTGEIPLDDFPPIVHLSMRPTPDLSVVSIDNKAGAKLATEHLIEQGCRKIGIITGPADWWEAQARLAGWREMLTQAGLKTAGTMIVEGNWHSESGKHAMNTLLAQRPDLDAVFVCNDMMALGALHTAHSQGIRIPEDLLMVGFDNIPEAASFWPPLSSVRQKFRHMGCLGVQELHNIIGLRNEDNPKIKASQQMTTPELIIRKSSTRS